MPDILPGRSFPLGATVYRGGVHFSVYSKNSTAMELLLFDHPDDAVPSKIIPLEPKINRTFYYWHAFVPGLDAGQLYAFRAIGPSDPARGMRFDSHKVLLDPYGRGVVFPSNYSRKLACLPGDNTAHALKSIVVDPSTYDWEGDLPLHRPFSQTVIYEMHPAGFTRHPNSGVTPAKRGTYAGLVEKIPYLQNLGITAVELLPVYAFDPADAPLGKTNYWGYSPISFFAPHPFYSSDPDPLGPINEFRDMVKAFHRAGIEVILDVVYNHTAEGDQSGPTLCFRGLENETYYILDPQDKSRYANYSGTGNTLNANHPVVRRMILDSLRYWVSEMHVDGFRFDLASILSRDEQGQPLVNPPVLWDIESDPYLAGAKLIAEAWDASGLYQVGSFIGERWKEWNGHFRDDVRSFVKGDYGSIRHLAERIQGSPDLYVHENVEPEQSINFITCHDGFTLNDLVSYSAKHNEANGENNRDGHNDNRSWNHGVEGPTTDPVIEALRNRQVKNFFAYTLLAIGTPMLLMGDEVRRTQFGNNNAYCQDNEISWFDWSLVERHGDILRFVKELIHFRLNFVTSAEDGRSLAQTLQDAQIAWHGVRLNQPDWRPESHALGMTITTGNGHKHMAYFFFNAYWEPLLFQLPLLPGNMAWHRIIDTALPSPHDITDRDHAVLIKTPTYCAEPRSVVVLVADE